MQSLHMTLCSQQKQFARHADQLKKVTEMLSLCNRIHMTIDQTLPVLERLNSLLPSDRQLEPFSLK